MKYIGYPSENNEWVSESEINSKFIELNEIEETKALNVKINGLETKEYVNLIETCINKIDWVVC